MQDLLRISDDFGLPVEAITEKDAILGMSGSGKTNLGRVKAERMLGHNLPIAVVDPLGVWWGLRLNAQGNGPGRNIFIFGGRKQDFPLPPDSGAMMADILVDERLPCIFDLSGLEDSDLEMKWMLAFLKRLQARNTRPLHLFLDEADMWAPQNADKGWRPLLKAMDNMARRGRIKGIGWTLMTQRPAVLDKSVLSQTNRLFVLKLMLKNDVDAVDSWVNRHANKEDARQMEESLPSLPVGAAWVWAPASGTPLKRIQVDLAETFDSSATPTLDDQPVQLSRLDDETFARLTAMLAAKFEAPPTQDPEFLAAENADLRRQLRERPPAAPPRIEEKPVFDREQEERLRAWLGDFTNALNDGRALVSDVEEMLSRVSAPSSPQAPPTVPPTLPAVPPTAPETKAPASHPSSKRQAARTKATSAPSGNSLPTPLQRVVDALAEFDKAGVTSVSRKILAVWLEVHPATKSYTQALVKGKEQALLGFPRTGMLKLTDRGFDVARPSRVVDKAALAQKLVKRLDPGHGLIFRALLEAHPRSLTLEELAERVSANPNSTGFRRDVTALTKLNIVQLVGKGFKAIFPEGLK